MVYVHDLSEAVLLGNADRQQRVGLRDTNCIAFAGTPLVHHLPNYLLGAQALFLNPLSLALELVYSRLDVHDTHL